MKQFVATQAGVLDHLPVKQVVGLQSGVLPERVGPHTFDGIPEMAVERRGNCFALVIH